MSYFEYSIDIIKEYPNSTHFESYTNYYKFDSEYVNSRPAYSKQSISMDNNLGDRIKVYLN